MRPHVPDRITKRSYDSQATWVIDMIGLFLDMLSIAVCTTRHKLTSARQVQELDVSTVPIALCLTGITAKEMRNFEIISY